MTHHGHFWRPQAASASDRSSSSSDRRRERWFKQVILSDDASGDRRHTDRRHPRGRYAAQSIWSTGRKAARGVAGPSHPPGRDRQRVAAVSGSRESPIHTVRLSRSTIARTRRSRSLMRYAGMDPEHGLLRWGNYNLTLLLPSTVFEADDTAARIVCGRAPSRSGFVRSRSGADSPDVFPGPRRTRTQGSDARHRRRFRVEESRQTTNSWGLRGPEPDLDAPLRGIVLGDSFMQGIFIGDDNTPPECLRRYLETRLKTRTSDSQHGPSRLLARAILLLAAGLRRSVPTPFRRREHFRQRLRRPLRGLSRAGRLGGGQVLARRDRAILPIAGLALPVRRGPRQRSVARPSKGRELPRKDFQHPGCQRSDVPQPHRGFRRRAPRGAPEGERARSSGHPAVCSSTSSIMTAISRHWARRSGPRAVGASGSCSVHRAGQESGKRTRVTRLIDQIPIDAATNAACRVACADSC